MDTTASVSTFTTKTLPFLALVRYDLRSLRESWLVRFWLIVSALLTLVILLTNWPHFATAPLIASLLSPYLIFPWFLVVIILGVNPVSGSQAEGLADGILSRPVTRHEYLLASWAARVLAVLGVYLVVIVPAVTLAALANRPAATDKVTLYGIVASVGVVGLVLVFQVSLGFLAGTLLRRPLLAIVVILFIWFPMNLILNTFSLEALSTVSLNQALPTLLRQPWHRDDAGSALDRSEDLAALSRWGDQFVQVLSGQPGAPPERPGFFNRQQYKDFSLLRVLLGYGLPTIAAVALSAFTFYRRDL